MISITEQLFHIRIFHFRVNETMDHYKLLVLWLIFSISVLSEIKTTELKNVLPNKSISTNRNHSVMEMKIHLNE